MTYLLLNRFRALFEGTTYLHRDSSLGDSVAVLLPEDLYRLGRSRKLIARADEGTRVLNTQNMRRGVPARRGDGTFGEIIPGTPAIRDPGFGVPRGAVATIEIGTEVKVLSKAMIKQIGRVKTDLTDQVEHFRRGGDRPITLAIVGINSAARYCSFEGDRPWPTDGTARFRHPAQEAAAAEDRIQREIRPKYDHLLILRFKATNEPPFPFEWVSEKDTLLDYGALLARISRDYEQRF